ncbi:MAG: sigma-70 family RNA polymerase sigma factor [Dorea sp.]|nr:sigma-70 family RNA polymerase sigma factor [Dorea sp.]
MGSIRSVDFDKVYEENISTAYRTALYYSEDENVAEEITQEVFLKLYISRENINTEAVSAWLVTTAKNMVRNHKRDCWHEVPKGDIFEDEDSDLLVSSTEEDIMTILHDKEYHEFVEKIFGDLYHMNERWYDAITITYLLEKPQKEVAENMGVSLEVLHSMLYRAKKWIQRKYREEYDRLSEI